MRVFTLYRFLDDVLLIWEHQRARIWVKPSFLPGVQLSSAQGSRFWKDHFLSGLHFYPKIYKPGSDS